MADQNAQHPNPPADDPKFLPLKKRAMAEKSIPGYNRVPESKSEPDSESESSDDDEDVMDYLGEELKKKTIEQLKRKAFYSVLRAFRAETSTTSNKRTQIIEKLMNEWNIADETQVSFEDHILAQQQRDEKEMQIEAEPLTTIYEKKATLNPSCVATSGLSWGSVDPKSLVGKLVSIRMPGEEHFEEFVIQVYDAQEEIHRLEPVYVESDAMERDGMLNWVDVREIPSEDIMWEGGERPNFDSTYGCFPRRSLF